MNSLHDIIIIGAGPAGISCAIQLKRYGLNPLIIEKDSVGGLLRNANLVENYLGFSGISGIDLIKNFEKQLDYNDVKVTYDFVNQVKFLDDVFTLTTNKTKYRTKYLIIASGTIAKKLDNNIIDKNAESLVFSEVFHLLDKKDKNIAIIGAGDAAFDYAINLSSDNHVTVFNKGINIKSLPLLFERFKKIDNLEYINNHSLLSAKKVDNKLKLIFESEGVEIVKNFDYLLTAIGRVSNRSFLDKTIDDNLEKLTNQGKLYFIGDVKNGLFRQTSIATGDGIRAAMECFFKIKGTE